MSNLKKRGFGSMTPERRAELGKKGGEVSRDRKTSHRWTKESASKAGKSGVQARRALKYAREQE